MLFFLLCFFAVLTVYFYTYILLGTKIKSRIQIAIFPALIIAFVFVWLIIDKELRSIVYILYSLAVIVVFTYIIYSFINKHIILSIIILIPTLISLYIIWWFIKETYFNPTPCDVINGCMNETGMFLVFSYFCMGLSFLIVVLSYLFKSDLFKKIVD